MRGDATDLDRTMKTEHEQGASAASMASSNRMTFSAWSRPGRRAG